MQETNGHVGKRGNMDILQNDVFHEALLQNKSTVSYTSYNNKCPIAIPPLFFAA